MCSIFHNFLQCSKDRAKMHHNCWTCINNFATEDRGLQNGRKTQYGIQNLTLPKEIELRLYFWGLLLYHICKIASLKFRFKVTPWLKSTNIFYTISLWLEKRVQWNLTFSFQHDFFPPILHIITQFLYHLIDVVIKNNGAIMWYDGRSTHWTFSLLVHPRQDAILTEGMRTVQGGCL